MDLFIRGVAIGFVIAAGLGPIGLLCIRRSLESGFGLGFATGLGAATADAAYAAVAAFGASVESRASIVCGPSGMRISTWIPSAP